MRSRESGHQALTRLFKKGLIQTRTTMNELQGYPKRWSKKAGKAQGTGGSVVAKAQPT